jgi:hypothetical protein
MQPLQLEFEATVHWVDPLRARYVDDASAMRRFRSLGQAGSFVLRTLPSDLRPDVRILTAARTLMYDEVVALDATATPKPQSLCHRGGSGRAGARISAMLSSGCTVAGFVVRTRQMLSMHRRPSMA